MATAVQSQPMQSSRPSIEIDGKPQPRLEAALVSYELADRIDSMARAELCFGNWGGEDHPGFQHFDRNTIEFGKALVVKQGDAKLFEGRITAIAAEYPEGATPQISVLAEDRLQDLRMTRRTRCFAQASLADVARSIAQDHGLTPQVDVNAPAVPLLAQLNQSDLAFLTDTARRYDADVHVEGKTLIVAAARQFTAAKLVWAGTLRSFSVIADLANQRSAVVAAGWDVARKQAINHRAAKDAASQEIGQDEAGGDILSRALGDRVETLAHLVPANEGEARQVAEAAYRHMARNFVTGEGVCETSALVRAGAKLELSGLGPLFDGAYRAQSVTHLFDPEHGARSEFRCNRAGLGRAQ
jgi:phage protein D